MAARPKSICCIRPSPPKQSLFTACFPPDEWCPDATTYFENIPISESFYLSQALFPGNSLEDFFFGDGSRAGAVKIEAENKIGQRLQLRLGDIILGHDRPDALRLRVFDKGRHIVGGPALGFDVGQIRADAPSALALDVVAVGAVVLYESLQPQGFRGSQRPIRHPDEVAVGAPPAETGEREIDDADDGG